MRLEQIKKIAIAGAGIMGASIAQIFAREGYRVALYDIAEAGIENGRKLILGGVEVPFDRGLLGHSDADVLTHESISFTSFLIRIPSFIPCI